MIVPSGEVEERFTQWGKGSCGMFIQASEHDLQQLRLLRTWLLIITTFGLGLQYALKPDRPLHAAGYADLKGLGERGWMIIGLIFIIVSLMTLYPPTQTIAFFISAFLFLILSIATILHGYWPATLLLPAGLNMGEVRLYSRKWRGGR